MCQLFIGAESDMWVSQSKSLRIDGVATSIRMENFFWSTLQEIAYRDCMTVNQLITKLYHESIDAEHDLGNFTSFLRVCCSRYLALIAAGDVSASLDKELGNVAADDILMREKARRQSIALKVATLPNGQKLN
ncbi:ribbon-helix-helix domain-containing protein [Terasakiella sp. A23]|uniref:ribbon-helix-helix domain-containing protein n=1 Tax=Terasakiella sp. FCG-A23 TaxID=3080561 RepID=UPI002953F785|nr:ribbon-helix-helix domain-containing protein [Terasakiella sp. A23]MDV7339762.1 ribbon-helix-helix domain-containing protein [Terasakiella sp. A23]